MPDQAPNTNAFPTRKWMAARIIALGALATMWATTGSFDQEETIAAIGIFVEAGVSYLTPNQPPVEEAADYAGV